MNRRDFTGKTLWVSGGIALGMNTINGMLNAEIGNQKFNFMSTSHPNLTLINSFFEAYGKNDIDSIKNILAADIKWHIPGQHPLSGTKKGVDEVLRFFQKLNKAAFKAEPIVMGVNDNYVIDCHKNWSNLETGKNLNAMSCLLWKIENNRIVEVHNFPENQHEVDAFFSKLYS
ncbi:nuclear transport factor 2 family protein [Ulvibacterium marinum]|uniref:Nuclear transport factor 2 family protein n=1 Tax=Ulvibacterium marinum TaxID=2419782 RepID=A0A3B0C5E8_9FLAO|nr:nuclear transport factor 2 family protein [Ulvibacterium marinum]RKN81293.1 nuclear transport factor 2 family protein [Ulvibacterium marinum]